MAIIALTGGIGSGKSEAAKQFAALGVPVVDTDVIAHELTAAGSPMLEKISALFGADFITASGALNRAKLREHIFAHPDERQKLEALLHPAIHSEALKQLANNQHTLNPAYQIIVVPLLFESNRYANILHQTLVIDCDESIQIERTMKRSQLTEAQVKTMIAAQVPRSVRLAQADDIIENNGTKEELLEKVNEIHKKFIKTCIVSK